MHLPKSIDISLVTGTFPGGSDSRESVCSARDSRFDPRVGKIPWRRKRQPTPVFLWDNPMDSRAWWATVHGRKESDITEQLTLSLTPQLWDVCRPYPRIEYIWASEDGFNTPESESLQASRRRRCQEAFLSLTSPFAVLPCPYTIPTPLSYSPQTTGASRLIQRQHSTEPELLSFSLLLTSYLSAVKP